MTDYCPDYTELYQDYEAKTVPDEDSLPKCAECGEPIRGECYFDILGAAWCEECINNKRRYF